MKRTLGLVIAFSILVGLFIFPPLANAEATPLTTLFAQDLTQYGNAMGIMFNQNITNKSEDVEIQNVQNLSSEDLNYDEDVLNGVLDGILIDGKSLREWNIDGPYGVMVHFYRTDSGANNYFTIWSDASLIDFSNTSHTITITSEFKAYSKIETIGTAFVSDPVADTWNTARVGALFALDLTGDGENALGIMFDKNITNSSANVTISNVQALTAGEANYDPNVVNGVLDGILVNGKSVREWNTESMYGIMVHFFRNADNHYITIYADASLVDFDDGDAHSVQLTGTFKDYLMRSAEPTSLYLDAETMEWSTTAPLPVIAVIGGDSHPDFAWGNTMRVLFDSPVWVPAHAEELLQNAQDLTSENEYYNADAVASINDKLIIDGKSVAEWNAQQAGTAAVHIGSSENDIRIYMEGALLGFGDGDTHVVTMQKNFITFSGKTTDEAVSLHYDPIAKTWGTETVVPPSPTPGAETAVFTVSPLLMSNQFGTAYFYTSSVITAVATINIQAGGGNIPEDVQNSVLDHVIVDGKTVREWNTENESNYAVMVAYETESNGTDTLGRIGFYIDTTSTCVFVPSEDHIIEFTTGLIGLNRAPILPSKWKWDAAEMDWFEITGESDEESSEDESSDPESDAPQTSDNFTYLFVFAAALSIMVVFRKRLLRA